jgi:hypothetical protein
VRLRISLDTGGMASKLVAGRLKVPAGRLKVPPVDGIILSSFGLFESSLLAAESGTTWTGGAAIGVIVMGPRGSDA